MEGSDDKGECISCGGRLVPIIECSSCGVRTVREELTPVQEAERCPVCDSPAKAIFQCEECNEVFSFADIIGKKEEKLVCPMCGALVEPDAIHCPSCGSSFGIEGLDEKEPERAQLRRKRKVIGEFVEEDVQEIMKIPGVGRLRAEVLCRAGYTSLDKLNRASVEELAKVRQIGMRTAKSIKEALQMMTIEPAESERLLEESIEEEFECPVCRTIVSAYDTECVECGAAFERVVRDKAFIEEIKKVGEEKSSLSIFDMKLLENPNDPQLWIGRAGVLKKMKKLNEALRSFEKAIELQPDLKTAWIAKAEILSKLGRLDEAASCYREIVGESATAAGIDFGGKEEATAALEELLAENCPSCGSSIPPGSNTCPSCGTDLVEREEEIPLETIDERVIPEDELERQLRELEYGLMEREVDEPLGLTNGRGLVNGRGKINGTGLVNGRGRINGTGMVNGRGLVNGKGIINGKGRVNGLINGNGFVNGLSLSNISRGRRRRVWPRYVAVAVALVILVVVFYGMAPVVDERVSPIVIDGQFQDWEGAQIYTQQGSGPNPDTSIVNYGHQLDDGYFSYLIGVQGGALADDSGYDSFYMFIDRDNNPDTGYIVRDMGAEYMVEAFGGGRVVAGTPIYGYMDTQDRHNFTQWTQIATGKAEVGGNRLEGQFVADGRFDLNGDFRVLFCADDYEGGGTYSSIKVGPEFGALLITQREHSPNKVLDVGSMEILHLTLEAYETDAHVNSISFSVIGAVAQPIVDVDVPAGSSVTRSVSVETTGLVSGDLISISVSSVDSDASHTVRGSGARAYFQSSPSLPQADGWFGEWDQQTVADSDGSPVTNPNNDIQESGVLKEVTDDAFFYLQVDGEMLGGFITPQVRFRSAPSQGPQGQPSPPVRRLNRMGGEDLTLIYIDSNTSDDTNGTMIQGLSLRPDHMVRVKGIYGEVTKKEMCTWTSGWTCTDLEHLAVDTSRMEVSVRIPDISSSEMEVAFASTDWRHRGDLTQLITRSEESRGQAEPEPLAPSWPSSWISVVTDADDGYADPSLEILEVYFNIDATYLYVRIRTESVATPVLTANTWWIYIDQDGDGTNDWIVIEMSGTGSGEVHGLAWNTVLTQWGGTAADWQDTLTDSDDDSAVIATTMTIGLSTYGCIDFAVLLTNIGTLDSDATIAAADSDTEDETLNGRTENAPDESLAYIVDATDSGQIPEFEFLLLPILLLGVFHTVMIKRRKHHSGS